MTEVDPDRVETERREVGEDRHGGRVEVVDHPRDPRQESGDHSEIRQQRRAARLRVDQPEPQQLRAEHERARVVRPQRRARGHGVEHPPACPASVEREQHRQRRGQRQQHQQAVRPGLGRVIDHERRQRGDRGRQQRRPTADRPQSEQVHDGNRERAGEQRGRAQQLGTVAELGRQPGRHKRQRRRDLRVMYGGRAVQQRQHSPEAVRGDDPVGGELVGKKRLVRDDHPDRDADDRQQRDRHGHAGPWQRQPLLRGTRIPNWRARP